MKTLLLIIISIANCRYCQTDNDCSGYKCRSDGVCCKDRDGCGAGYSWPCCKCQLTRGDIVLSSLTLNF